MKYILISLTFFISISVIAQKNTNNEIKETFKNYRIAVLNNDGEKAVKFISNKTLQYYSNILQKIKTADSLEIEKLPLIDKLAILIIRHKVPVEKIKTFDDKSLVIYAIDNGMIGKETVAKYSIGKVNVENKNVAFGQLILDKKKTQTKFKFYKENKIWKIDLTSIMEGSNKSIENIIEKSGLRENEFIFWILNRLTGEKPTKKIWKPI